MTMQRHVLLVTNAASEAEISLIKDALARADENGMQIKVSLVHVIPSLPTCYFNIPSMIVLAERYYEEAKLALTSIGEMLGIAKDNQWLVTGRARTETLRLADRIDAHFILASSTNIQDLQKTMSFKKEQKPTVIRNISAISSI